MLFKKLCFFPVAVAAVAISACGATSVLEGYAAPAPPTASGPTASVDLPREVDALAQDQRFVYAATSQRVGNEGAAIYRIAKADARVETLVEAAGEFVRWMDADAGGVYWVRNGDEASGIWRMRQDDPEPVRIVAAEWVVDAALDEDRIFYLEAPSGGGTARLRSVPKAGGTPADGPSIPGAGLVTDAAFVYSCSAEGIYRTPKSGGQPERIGAPDPAWAKRPEDTAPCGKLRKDGERLSWLYNARVLGHSTGNAVSLLSPTGVFLLPVTGGVTSKVASGNIGALASRSGENYYLEHARHQLIVRSTRGVLRTVTFDPRTGLSGGAAIIADDERVYWSEPTFDGEVWHGAVRFTDR